MKPHELESAGFSDVGSEVRISSLASIHGADRIRIGDHVRIDDFAVVTAMEDLVIGSHVHIATHVFLSVTDGGRVGDHSGLSPGSVVMSGTDDFSGVALTGPTVPERFRNVQREPVEIGRHVVVGARSVVLPGGHLADGAAVGALSLVDRPLAPWRIYVGIPVREVRERRRRALELAVELEQESWA